MLFALALARPFIHSSIVPLESKWLLAGDVESKFGKN